MAMVSHVEIIFNNLWLQKLTKIDVISTSTHNQSNTKLIIFTTYVNKDIAMHTFFVLHKKYRPGMLVLTIVTNLSLNTLKPLTPTFSYIFLFS